MDVLVVQVLIGGPWDLAIYGKGTSTPGLAGQRTLCLWKGFSVQVLVMSWVLWFFVLGGGKTLVLGAAGAQSCFICACFGCMTVWFCSFLSEKQLSVLLNRNRIFLSWFWGYTITYLCAGAVGTKNTISYPSYSKFPNCPIIKRIVTAVILVPGLKF